MFLFARFRLKRSPLRQTSARFCVAERGQLRGEHRRVNEPLLAARAEGSALEPARNREHGGLRNGAILY